ncbi:MAG: transglutaminase domain-containing protein [Bacteroidetes bacterium]|nr:transglutaminase domain-containing protein [Bacteroidota bacterium]
MVKPVFILFFLLSAFSVWGADNKYAYADINPSLLMNADAVVRDYKCSIEILANDKIVRKEHVVVTVLNEKGYENAVLDRLEDEFVKLDDASGYLYDASGRELKKMKQRDIVKTHIASYNVFDKDFQLSYDFHYAIYPFTVEYETTEKIASFLFVSDCSLLPGFRCAAENINCSMVYPQTMDIRYELFHISEKPVESVTDNSRTWNLSLHNINAYVRDRLAPRQVFDIPAVVFAANTVQMGPLTGNMDTWQHFGKFFYDLNIGRDVLPDDVKHAVHQLTDTCKTQDQKIGLLYDYLKANTRYVSIQLGIGGFQAFPAEYVMKNGYGDCKALSNCMMALLKEAGVTSYTALVYGGADYRNHFIQSDIPSDVFNHEILCAVDRKDTTWIECTSHDLPAGYLSHFTGNRKALLLTPGGGVVVNTPAYKIKENVAATTVMVNMDGKGGLSGTMHTSESGRFYDLDYQHLYAFTKKDRDLTVSKNISVQDLSMGSCSVALKGTSKLPSLVVDVDFTGKATFNSGGKRIFFVPVFSHVGKIETLAEAVRNTDFYIASSFDVRDTTIVNLDSNYKVEFLPKDIDIVYAFGSYSRSMVVKENVLTIIRAYKQQEGEYSAALYPDYIKFHAAIPADGLAGQVVFAKKD